MTLVTRDATSGRWTPRSNAEYTSLLSGRGINNPKLLWMPGDPASGNVPDLIGTFTGTVGGGGGVHYQQAVTGWATKAMTLDDGTIAKVVNQDVGLPDISASAMLAFMWGAFASSTPSERSVLTFGPTFGSQAAFDIWNSTPNHFAYAYGGGSAGGGAVQSTATATGIHPVILQIDRPGSATALVQTEAETLSHATLGSETGKSIAIGGDNVSWWFAGNVQYMLVACWFGADAQLDAAHRAALIDAHVNGPAVTSIAVTPTPVTLVHIGDTQQLTATATRADGSTFDITATATWSSDNPSAATVNASGLVTGTGAGIANISCTYTSLGAATATSNASVVTVTGVLLPSVVPALNSVLTFLRFDEPKDTIAPSDALASLNDLKPIAATPAVVNAFCGFGRQLGNGLAFTATDTAPGATLTTRDVTVQAILSWDMTAQVALGTDGTIVARGLGGSAAEYVAYALQLHVVNAALQIGELSLWWQDTAGGVHIEPGGQFVLPPAASFMMLTAVRHWVDATHVEVRYYAGDQLLSEFLTSDGDIGGGTTGTFCVGARYSGGVPGNYLCGVIDQYRVLNYELTAEEIAATWTRLSVLQPRAYSAMKQLMQPGAPITNDPSSRIQKLLRIAGHLLGYAAAQAENMRLNTLADRAYGRTLAQHERIMGESPGPRDSVQTRRKRLLGHLRQKAGVSIPGIAASVADLLAIGKSQVQVLAFDNTIRDDFSLGLRNTLWMADDPAQWAVSGGALHVTGANAASLPMDGTTRNWYTCLAAALGSRVSADGRPTAANDTTNFFDGRACHLLAKMTPTTLPSNGEVGLVFFNLAKGNALLFGVRNLTGSYSIVTETFANWVSGGATVQAATSLTTHWLHLWQNVHPGWSAGNRFYNAAWSTTGQTTGYTTTGDIQHVAEFNWMGMYMRTFGGGTLAAAADVAFDDVIMRHPFGSRPFRFYVYRDPTLPGAPDLVGAEAAVKRLQQAHTSGHVITQKVALCDTAGAGCDRSPMGGF